MGFISAGPLLDAFPVLILDDGIHWISAGGESGPGAWTCNDAGFRDLEINAKPPASPFCSSSGASHAESKPALNATDAPRLRCQNARSVDTTKRAGIKSAVRSPNYAGKCPHMETAMTIASAFTATPAELLARATEEMELGRYQQGAAFAYHAAFQAIAVAAARDNHPCEDAQDANNYLMPQYPPMIEIYAAISEQNKQIIIKPQLRRILSGSQCS